jgi:hypothetical protein
MKQLTEKATNDIYELIKDTFEYEKFTHARFHNRVDSYCREKGLILYKKPVIDYLGLSIDRRNAEIKELKSQLHGASLSDTNQINMRINEIENGIKADIK